MNADPQELAKFSELAHLWWDPDSDFRPLHRINPLRLDWVDSMAGLPGKQVLDVGCGGGILAESMARRGAHVLGIDLATKRVDLTIPTSDARGDTYTAKALVVVPSDARRSLEDAS